MGVTYEMPDLPDGQRWLVCSTFNTFLDVKLQERRWWGWRTIAMSTGFLDEGAEEIAELVDQCLRRDYYDMLDSEDRAEREQRRSEIPFGAH